MEADHRRSTGVEQVATAPAAAAPADAELAFDRLYRDCRDDVFGYVAGLLRDRTAAEDVTAQAFERAYRRRRGFDPQRGSGRAWLFGIARNAALDELRRRKRHAALAADPEDLAAAVPHESAEVALRRAALREAMATLDARERELVSLKFFAGLTNAEIAAVIGTTATNAGTRLHRTMDKLRRACDEAA
jgi:RNA polymerase sigma-70 factor (ECF subfamily)